MECNMRNLTIEEQLAVQAGKTIDPETAEVTWDYRQILDPYGIIDDLAEECNCVGRVFFARAPNSETWVWFGHLPEEVREKLLNMHCQNLYFPAGLPDPFFRATPEQHIE